MGEGDEVGWGLAVSQGAEVGWEPCRVAGR